MAENAGAVTQQPRSKKRELEEFVRDLDPIQVQGQEQTACTCIFVVSCVSMRMPRMPMLGCTQYSCDTARPAPIPTLFLSAFFCLICRVERARCGREIPAPHQHGTPCQGVRREQNQRSCSHGSRGNAVWVSDKSEVVKLALPRIVPMRGVYQGFFCTACFAVQCFALGNVMWQVTQHLLKHAV